MFEVFLELVSCGVVFVAGEEEVFDGLYEFLACAARVCYLAKLV